MSYLTKEELLAYVADLPDDAIVIAVSHCADNGYSYFEPIPEICTHGRARRNVYYIGACPDASDLPDFPQP